MSAPSCFNPTPELTAAALDLYDAAKLAESYLDALIDPDVDAATLQRGSLTVWTTLRDAIRKAEGRA